MSTTPLEPIAAPADTPRHTPVAAWWHTALLIAVILSLAYLQGRPGFAAKAAQLPSKIPIYLETLVYELLLFVYVWFLGLRPKGVSISEIIGGKWKRFEDFLIDVATAFLFWIAVVVVLIGLEFALKFNGTKAAEVLLPLRVPEMLVFALLSISAGFCEEFVFRGYFQRQFLALTQSVPAAVALQAIVFGAAHFYQGWRGVIVITVYGAMFGALAAIRKTLRPGMMQHATQDTISGIAGGLLLKYHKLV
jgi:membrane protease YdiL (CAAX protease family)